MQFVTENTKKNNYWIRTQLNQINQTVSNHLLISIKVNNSVPNSFINSFLRQNKQKEENIRHKYIFNVFKPKHQDNFLSTSIVFKMFLKTKNLSWQNPSVYLWLENSFKRQEKTTPDLDEF